MALTTLDLAPPPRETRAAASTNDGLLLALVQGGAAGSPGEAAIAIIEAAAALWARGLSAATVEPAHPAVNAALRAAIGRDLAQHGESLHALSVDPAGRVRFDRASPGSTVFGGPDPETWIYQLTLAGPTLTRTVTRPAAAVLHVRINEAAFTPWRGRAPHQVAPLTASLAGEIEHHFGRAATGPALALMPMPDSIVQAEVDKVEAKLADRGDSGIPVATPRTTQAGWDGDGGGRPTRDWDPRYLRLSPTREAVELRRDVETSLARAYGIPAAMLSPTVAGSTLREAARQVDALTLAPIARLVAAELERVLERPLELSLEALRLADVQGKARAFRAMVDAQMPVADARKAAGL